MLFKWRPKANALLIHDGQSPSQIVNQPWISEEPIQHCDYFSGSEVVREPQYDNAAVLLGRVMPYISEIQVARQQRSSGLTGTFRDLSIRGSGQPDISREFGVVTASAEGADCRPRQIGIDQEAHKKSGGRKRVKRFLLRQFGYEQQRSPDVVGGDVIFPLDFLEGHPASQAAHNHRYRQAGTSDHGFAVSDGRVENNAVRGSHNG